uniref:Uncharacterized protein n=1 Tax=Setaria viridis TaxID=4556 RepID=A0A4U6U5G4_SETVI|nr:LOW QUALITY PROTEIN: hypothetical protein SEVIR_6G145800v2 [Setaria viridis]
MPGGQASGRTTGGGASWGRGRRCSAMTTAARGGCARPRCPHHAALATRGANNIKRGKPMQAATTTTDRAHPHMKPPSASFLWLPPPLHLPRFSAPEPKGDHDGSNVEAAGGAADHHVLNDWNLHVREGGVLEAVLPHSARHFGRAIIMPNLKPPVTKTARAPS